MENEYRECPTFTITDKAGNKVEMAVIDEFDFENKSYVASAVIDGDTIKEDGIYIYRVKVTDDDFQVEKITNHVEYQRVAEAYMEMDE